MLGALLIGLAGAGFIGVNQANAQTQNNPMSSLIEKIAFKFNLNKADVQAVFDQDRADHESERESQYEDQLSQYVKEGKITQTQKQLILAKHKEMIANHQSEMQNNQNLTKEEKHAARDKKQRELKDWATQNNIDIKYLMPFGGRERMHGNSPNAKLSQW